MLLAILTYYTKLENHHDAALKTGAGGKDG